MTMRKCILAATTLLALTACSSNEDDTKTPTNTPAKFSGDLAASVSAIVASVQGSVTITDPDNAEATMVAQTDVASTNGTFSIATDGQ